MSCSPYAEESLRVLHEVAVSSCNALMADCDAIALSSAITRLAVDQQLMLTLIYVEGFEAVNIASILDISPVEVVRLHASAVLALCQNYESGT